MKNHPHCDYDITDPELVSQRRSFISTIVRTQSLRAGISGFFRNGLRARKAAPAPAVPDATEFIGRSVGPALQARR